MVASAGSRRRTPVEPHETITAELRGGNMTRTLDKSRPFGEIIGSPAGMPTARFDQDGLYFDGQGNLLPGQDVPEPESTVEPEPTTREDDILAMHKAGKSPVEISRETGLHFNAIKALIRRATA